MKQKKNGNTYQRETTTIYMTDVSFIVKILNTLIKKKNKRHANKEATVPGAYFIFPIMKKVRKNKLNFLIIFNN